MAATSKHMMKKKIHLCAFLVDKVSDVPEAILPEPFTQRRQINVPKKLLADCCVKSQSNSTETELLSENSYPKANFSRHFSRNAIVVENETIQDLVSTVLPPLKSLDKQESKKEQQRDFFGSVVSDCITSQDTNNSHVLPKNFPGTCSESNSMNPQPQPNYPQTSLRTSTAESPLVKLTSSLDRFMIETPSQKIPSRLVSSCDVEHKKISSQRSNTCCKPAKRFLNFFHSEGDESASSAESADKSKCDKIVCQHISQITEGFSEDGNTLGSSALSQEVCPCSLLLFS